LEAYCRGFEDGSASTGGGLAAAHTAALRAYLDGIAARRFATSSQARRLSALRQFFAFLYAEGLRDDDPTGTLDSPKKAATLPKIMSEAETGRLLDRAALEAADPALAGGDAVTPLRAGGDAVAALRLHALVEVLYATGLRVSELV